MDHYKYFADYHKASAQMLRIDGYVHVEGRDDKPFWEAVLHQYLPHKKFVFLTQSQSERGMLASGVSQCLKYRKWLDERFFICIDSDYRYLMNEEGIDASHYIFQTYTYSIENHYCYENRLDDICFKAAGVKNDVFDFSAFLKQYSAMIYELFVCHIFLQEADSEVFTKGEFNAITALKREGESFAVKDKGRGLLDHLSAKVAAKMAALHQEYPHFDMTPMRERLAQIGVTRENCYRFVRGHDLFDGLLMICKRVCDVLLKQIEDPELRKRAIARLYGKGHKLQQLFSEELAFDAYPEICKIAEDLRRLESDRAL